MPPPDRIASTSRSWDQVADDLHLRFSDEVQAYFEHYGRGALAGELETFDPRSEWSTA